VETIPSSLTWQRDPELGGDERCVIELRLGRLLQVPVDAVLEQGLDLAFQSLHERVANAAILDALVLDRERFFQPLRDPKLQGHLYSRVHEVQGHVASPWGDSAGRAWADAT